MSHFLEIQLDKKKQKSRHRQIRRQKAKYQKCAHKVRSSNIVDRHTYIWCFLDQFSFSRKKREPNREPRSTIDKNDNFLVLSKPKRFKNVIFIDGFLIRLAYFYQANQFEQLYFLMRLFIDITDIRNQPGLAEDELAHAHNTLGSQESKGEE